MNVTQQPDAITPTRFMILTERAHATFVYRPGTQTVTHVDGGLPVRSSQMGVQFQADGGLRRRPQKVLGLPRGRARGRIFIDKASRETGVPQADILRFFTDPEYVNPFGIASKANRLNIDFCLADENGNPVDPSDVGLSKTERVEADVKRGTAESYARHGLRRMLDDELAPEEQGQHYWWCEMCDQKLQRGISGHIRSNKHIAARDARAAA